MSTARAPEALQRPAPRVPPKPDLRLVLAPGVGRRAGRVILTVVVAGMFGALLLSAVFHSVLVSGQQRLDRLESEVQQDQQRLARARLRVALLSSPNRIVDAAQTQGMVVPDHVTWLTTPPPPAAPTPPASSTPAPATSAPDVSASGRQRAGAGVAPPTDEDEKASPPPTSTARPTPRQASGASTRSGPTR